MSDLNVIAIEGRLTKSAELSRFSDGTAYCSFFVANNESYKGSDGKWNDIVSYFECGMRGNFAEAYAKHLIKGREVRVTGRLKQNRWEKDGQKYSKVIIKVQELHLGYKPGSNNNNEQQYNNYQSQETDNNFQSKPQQEFRTDDIGGGPDFIPFNEDIPF